MSIYKIGRMTISLLHLFRKKVLPQTTEKFLFISYCKIFIHLRFTLFYRREFLRTLFFHFEFSGGVHYLYPFNIIHNYPQFARILSF